MKSFKEPFGRFKKNSKAPRYQNSINVAPRNMEASASNNPEKENPQLQSIFFTRFPLEIRRLIYEFVIQGFGWGDTVHIVTRSQLTRASPTPWLSPETVDATVGNKLAYVPCAAQLGDPFQISGSHYGHWPRGHLACERIASWQTAWPSDGPPKPKYFTLGLSHLSLFLTCQRMYSEVSDPLYSSLCFDALGLAAADRFLATVAPRHLNRIRKLHLSWQTTVPIWLSTLPGNISELDRVEQLAVNRTKLWTSVCHAIKGMQCLQDLRIAIYDVNWRPTPEDELLEPVMDIQIRGGMFIVELKSVEGDDVRQDDIFTGEADAPFQIQRRAKGFDDSGNQEINVGITGDRRRRRPRILWVLVPFLCVYYTVETLVECSVEKVRHLRRM